MYPPGALTASPAVEGAFAFGEYNVASSVVSGPAASLRAGPGGTAFGRFGWCDSLGVVRNVRLAASDVLGFIIPQWGPQVDWRLVFFDDTTQTWRVREGMPLTMLATGNVWAKFLGGAYPGNRVYANLLDGAVISGYSDAGELTPWSVAMPVVPGGLGVISTWSVYT